MVRGIAMAFRVSRGRYFNDEHVNNVDKHVKASFHNLEKIFQAAAE
jgi:hypothetical protein